MKKSDHKCDRGTIAGTALAAALLTGFAGFGISEGRAQTAYPSRPITLVTVTAPGDPGDVVVRLVQSKIAERLGQPFMIDSRPGASGQIASNLVAKAPPDGHTLLLGSSGHIINPIALKQLPYDTVRDFAGVSLLVRQPLVIAVHASVKGANMREFIEAARTLPPGTLNFSSPGLNSLNYLIAEQISRRAGFGMVHLPFKGGSPAIQALVANQAQVAALFYSIMRPHISAGRIRPIAVTSANRLRDLPEVPTVAESGFPESEVTNFIGIFAPAATPAAVIAHLQREFGNALADAEIRSRLMNAGWEVVGSPPQELDRFVGTEIARWEKFVREFNIRFE